MRPLFKEFHDLWPTTRISALEYLFKDFSALRWPADAASVGRGDCSRTVIVVDRDEDKINPVEYLAKGYEHVLFSKREDFAAELFTSCMMMARPENFAQNPIPFFFNGFTPVQFDRNKDTTFLKIFNSSDEKPYLINELKDFLKQEKALSGIEDLCLQCADELITNAIYNAPVDMTGQHIFKNTPRETDVVLPPGSKVSLFAYHAGGKVVIGCEDPFGSIDRATVLERAAQVYNKSKVSPLMTTSGTGLGLRLMIESSANFYMYCQSHIKTLVACGFLLQGRQKNFLAGKHMHVSIR
jgi:hypothetical protein